MERIVYRKTLDVHKNGVQFTLQGFETADRLSRVIEINLMASGDAIDLPIERLEALMYVTTPGATEPSINKCTIKNNTIVYDVIPIAKEGITTMQLKLIESRKEGASGVLASPKFAVEVTKSDADDGEAEKGATFTALEEAIAMAREVYDKACIRIELTSDCILRAEYNDGSYYETDLLKKLFVYGDVKLSESFAKGGTGVRDGEDTDNSMYYSNVAKSEALNAKDSMETSKAIYGEVQKQGVYTSFTVDFSTGELEYVSPASEFEIDNETGELVATRNDRNFQEAISDSVEDFLESKGIKVDSIKENASDISELQGQVTEHTKQITDLQTETTPIDKGGTGATTKDVALANLGALSAEIVTHQFNDENKKDPVDGYVKDTIEFENKPLLVIFQDVIAWNNLVPYGQTSANFTTGTSSNHISVLEWGKNETGGKHYLTIKHGKYSNLKDGHERKVVAIINNSDTN